MSERAQSQLHRRARRSAGFSLAEVLITIGLTAVLLTIYTMMLISTMFLRRSQHYSQASNLIQEELDSLRLLEVADITNRTDGSFLNVVVNRGDWEVLDKTGDGQDQRLTLTAAETETIDESGLIALPINQSDDFTYSAKVRALTGSPGTWDTGIMFRYQDVENHYRLRFNSGGLAFDKVVKGVATTIYSQSYTYALDTWYELEVVAAGDEFAISRDGNLLTNATDDAFAKGELALAAFDGALVEFDDVSATIDAVASVWDFEVYSEGVYPADWKRIGWPDLPNGTGTLTVADYEGISTIKETTVTVTWTESESTKSATGSTLIIDR